MIMLRDIPRTIDPTNVFNALVDWFHDEMIVKRKAPGFLIGLSGTDSIVAFLAASKAFERAGRPERVLGIHFAPSEDFLYDHPEAEIHLWFTDVVMPWLRQQTNGAKVEVNTSIDWRYDGLRWGALMDRSVVSTDKSIKMRTMRPLEEQYWVVGTRNLTEDTLLNYSNASTAANLQPLIHLWKSEILQISKYLGVPQIALDKSCETDCICGRLRLPSQHIPEVDMLLMVRIGELVSVENRIPIELQKQLTAFINDQISKGDFKKRIPYTPSASITNWTSDPLVISFEEGTLNLKEFNHRKHVYVAWCYLKDFSFGGALSCYNVYLKYLLELNGQAHRFNLQVTRSYFEMIDAAIKLHPMDNFDQLVEKVPSLIAKKQQTSA
jgi:NH3-dependent NAD+ synthetase